MTAKEVKVSEATIQYLKQVAAEGARLAQEGTYSLNVAMETVDARLASTAQPTSNPPKTA